MAPITLTDQQLQQIRDTAAPIPRHMRGMFLQRLAELRGCEVGDGDLHRTFVAASLGGDTAGCGGERSVL